MRWLQEFLDQKDKSQADLARHLGIAKARISEIISGKGKRRIHANEVRPMAEFLEEPILRILALASGEEDPGRNVAPLLLTHGGASGMTPPVLLTDQRASFDVGRTYTIEWRGIEGPRRIRGTVVYVGATTVRVREESGHETTIGTGDSFVSADAEDA